MRLRDRLFILLMAVTVIGFFEAGTVQALEFADWPGTWFKVTVSETGKAGPVAPPGGKVVKNNEKATTAYFLIKEHDTVSSFKVVFCTVDGSSWSRKEYPWPILGGKPTNFLIFFEFQSPETQNIFQTYWIPIEVKGKEDKQTVGKITSASFKNKGGIFLEEVGDVDVTQRGMGSVKFNGSLISSDEVDDEVPLECLIP